LIDEEEEWRRKSRATWLLRGDRNTKFFHRYTNHSKNNKVICEILDGNGYSHSGQRDLEDEAVKHFKSQYANSGQNFICDQVSTMHLYLGFLIKRDVLEMEKPYTTKEILLVLKILNRDKSHGPDGWRIEFFSVTLI